MSPNTQFSGSFDRLMVTKPLSAGYLLSVAELKAGPRFNMAADNNQGFENAPVTEVNSYLHSCRDVNNTSYELPHVPPWFISPNGEKLYHALAGILRLVGLSTNVCPPGLSSAAHECIHKMHAHTYIHIVNFLRALQNCLMYASTNYVKSVIC